MRPRELRQLLQCLGALIAASCASSGPFVERGQPAGTPGAPVLVGTLVDGDGHALPLVSATFNHWEEGSVCGGQEVITDQEGRFRIELSSSFVEPSSGRRTVGLAGSKDAMAFFDARCSLPPGVHDIGDLLFSDPADARTLVQLSDDRLLSRLEFLTHWSSDALDACLRECARRGGRRIIVWLTQRELSDGGSTNIAVVTARNRAGGLADPLVLELVDGRDAAISCPVGELPAVRLAFVNLDPLKRTLRMHCTEPECHDEGLAVDCRAAGASEGSFRLLRPSHQGAWPGGKDYELAPGEEVVVPVPLSNYVQITAPGRYSCRLAFRMDGWWDLAEGATDLPRGVLFLYSQPFVLEVVAAKGG